MTRKHTLIILLVFFIGIFQDLQAQDWKEDRKVGLVFGLAQPLALGGFNVEGVYIHKRLIFDYSHGVALSIEGSNLNDELKAQGLVVYMPFTTGFGVGYRFTEWLNLRVEPKWHRFQIYYEGDARTEANRLTTEDNFSLGLGLYGFWQPFKNKENALKGITIAPSVRFWPMVSTNFDDRKFTYENRNSGSSETINSLASGIGFTPLIINISIGYTFDLKKR